MRRPDLLENKLMRNSKFIKQFLLIFISQQNDCLDYLSEKTLLNSRELTLMVSHMSCLLQINLNTCRIINSHCMDQFLILQVQTLHLVLPWLGLIRLAHTQRFKIMITKASIKLLQVSYLSQVPLNFSFLLLPSTTEASTE